MADEEAFLEDDNSYVCYSPEIAGNISTEEAAETSKTVRKWGVEDTRFMLDLYIEGQKEVGPLKKFRLKKQLWAHIADKLSEKYCELYTALQVESRYKCVNKRTKKAVENNCTSGACFEETPYDEEIRQLMRQDDSICPEVMVSPGIINRRKDFLEPDLDAPTSSPAPRKRNNQSNFDKYFELQAKKLKLKEELEEKRQERHKETMSLLKELIAKK